ncbi:unnamed protein product [Darwinula stevensoni]|uniref:Cytoplasmic protein NCK1 n=1 Tax=Darwinula stevensoni TaxID=69355 RepID=A0A7R8X913_9CRUS|nr:unnamed protein product [Darwinula stevensoni]CAG0884005.1 unnamed protein product [Darwinula stevensoni]
MSSLKIGRFYEHQGPVTMIQINRKSRKGIPMPEESYVIAKYDYVAQGSQELDAKKNERLLLLDDSKHWWRVQNARGQNGYVPSNYVKREKPSIFDSIKKRVKKSGSSAGSKTLPSSSSASPSHDVPSPSPSPVRRPVPPIDPREGIGYAIVKYNYTAQQPDELPLTKGTRILILEKSNDGWWKGQYGNQMGWFPSNYTIEEVEESVHTYARAENVLDIVLALYSFTARNDQELGFRKGEKLEIVDRPASDPEWYKARNAAGQVGLVPSNYLKEVGDGHGHYEAAVRRRGPPDGSSNVSGPVPETTHNGAVTEAVHNLSQLNLTPDTRDRPHLAGREWYYGMITRAQCDALLGTYGQDGDFLVRDSETNVGDYSVSLKAPGRNKHFRVHVDGNLYCIGQRKFQNLDQLVDHYQRAPIYTSQKGEKLYLIRPFPRPNFSTSNPPPPVPM